MTRQRRIRHDPRRDTTRAALIEAAERLFANAGVDGVSTRSIGAAIGSQNNNVVTYHFGTREALIEAVYRHRLPSIEARRRLLLDRAISNGTADRPWVLLEALLLPLCEQVDADGQHSYVRFLAGLERCGLLIDSRRPLSDTFVEANDIVGRLQAVLPAQPASLLSDRLRIATAILYAQLAEIDRERPSPREAKVRIDAAISMIAGALAAPVHDEENP